MHCLHIRLLLSSISTCGTGSVIEEQFIAGTRAYTHGWVKGEGGTGGRVLVYR